MLTTSTSGKEPQAVPCSQLVLHEALASFKKNGLVTLLLVSLG